MAGIDKHNESIFNVLDFLLHKLFALTDIDLSWPHLTPSPNKYVKEDTLSDGTKSGVCHDTYMI